MTSRINQDTLNLLESFLHKERGEQIPKAITCIKHRYDNGDGNLGLLW